MSFAGLAVIGWIGAAFYPNAEIAKAMALLWRRGVGCVVIYVLSGSLRLPFYFIKIYNIYYFT
ncbi:hypothetical protein DPQ22_05030 [Candidatus Tokpelaia sp.]|nr:hypothetical protein DPQ22_05030 [Candidatus Tokpelaia sp.]